MDPRFRVLAGPDKGLSFQLPPSGVESIGRSRQHAEICLHDPNVARVHCQVEVEKGSVLITDLDSDNGTYVNGERVIQCELHHGDLLKVGDSELCFEAIGSGRPAVAAATLAESSGTHPALPARTATSAKSSATHKALTGQTAAPLAVDKLESLMGTTLGHHEVGPMLGKGHCGMVFRARNLKDDRVVALKVLHADFPKTEEEAQRFIEAFKLISPLRHPHVVSVLGFGRTGKHAWISWELVEGESLARILERNGTAGPPAWQEAFRLAVHGARALHFAHHHRLLHRNITPANLLFSATSNSFKLSDLVLAKALTGTQLRQAAMRSKIETEVLYFPPEQTHPSPNLDYRTDIYSLGASVYQLLTNRPPCTGKSAVEIAAAIREASPVKPTECRPDTPLEFEAVVLKMLAKAPEKRYQNAAELLADLARIAPEPV